MKNNTVMEKNLRQIINERIANESANGFEYPLTAYGEDGASRTTLLVDADSAQLVTIHDKWISKTDKFGVYQTTIGEAHTKIDVIEILEMTDKTDIREFLLRKTYPDGYREEDSSRFYWRLFSPGTRRPLM